MNRSSIVRGVAGLCLALATSSYAGLTFTTVTKVEGGKSKDVGMSFKASIEGQAMKVEYLKGHSSGLPSDAYILAKNGGEDFYMVNPKEKTYMKWNTDQMMGMAGTAMSMMKTTVTDPKFEEILSESGPAILGHSTHHYRFRTSYTMDMSIFGRHTRTATVQEEDLWCTTELDMAVLNAWRNRQWKNAVSPDLSKLMEMQQKKVKGFPLKQITKTMATNEKGETNTSLTTMEVTELKEVSIPASFFEIPACYKEFNMENAAEAREGGDKDAPSGGDAEENQPSESKSKSKMPSFMKGLFR